MQKRNGFSLIELLIVVAIILVIAAIAIPNLLRSRMAANEASAVNTVRTVSTGQITYKIFYPSVGYAATLDNLSAGSGIPDQNHADLVPNMVSTPPYRHSGYSFATTGTPSDFDITAVPITPGQTGMRSFCTDTPAAIYFAAIGATCVTGTNPLQ